MKSDSPKVRISFAHVRLLSIVLLFLTGASGLVYEVTWQRYLSNLVGSESRASALILAVFLGGLSIGYALFGSLSRNRTPQKLVKLTGWLEVGIGIWAVLFPSLYNLAWQQIANQSVLSSGGLIADFLLASLLIAPPTILMGGTLPLLTQALSLDLEESAWVHAWIYSVNTAGAFIGCLLAGFVFLPLLGLPLTMLDFSAVNLGSGFLLIGLGTFLPKTSPVRASVDTDGPSFFSRKLLTAHGLAFVCGFCAIAVQTLLVRLVGLSLGSSEYSFSIVVAIYICMLAWGAYRVAQQPNGRFNALGVNLLIVSFGLILVYYLAPYWPYWAHVLHMQFAPIGTAFYFFYAAVFVSLGVLLLIPIHAMGKSMPLLFTAIADDAKSLGRRVGTIYFANTLGCVLGAIVGGYLIYFELNLDQVLKLLVGLSLASSFVAALVFHRARLQKMVFAGSLVLLVLILALDTWNEKYFAMGTFRIELKPESFAGRSIFYDRVIFSNGNLLFYQDDPNSTVAIVEQGSFGQPKYNRSIFVNGKSDSNTYADRVTTGLMAYLPSLFTVGEIKDVAVIGFGTGVTAGAFSTESNVDKIHVFEISNAIHEHADFFDFADHDFSKNKKAVWHIGDAYRFFVRNPNQFSIISSEPSNPWTVGVERLYTKEFFSIAKSRLETGGVFAQWFHNYDMSLETLKIVVRTFSEVFPNVRIFISLPGDIILLGTDAPFDTARLNAFAKRWETPDLKSNLKALDFSSPSDMMAREVPLPIGFYFENSEDHSLEFPKLSYRAGKDFFRHTTWDASKDAADSLYRPWRRKHEANDLVWLWYASDPSPDRLHELIQSTCRHPGFFAEWPQGSEACKKFLGVGVARGLVDGKSYLKPHELLALHAMLDPKQVSHLQAPPSALDGFNELRFLSAFDSPVLPVTKELVEHVASSCRLDSMTVGGHCLLEEVALLSWIGEIRPAAEILHDLSLTPHGLEASELKAAADLLKQATLAYAPDQN